MNVTNQEEGYIMSDSELHPEYRSLEEKVEDFLKCGERSIYYPAFLKRLGEHDQLLENNYLIAKVYAFPKFGDMEKINKLTTENAEIVCEIVEEMILNGGIIA